MLTAGRLACAVFQNTLGFAKVASKCSKKKREAPEKVDCQNSERNALIYIQSSCASAHTAFYPFTALFCPFTALYYLLLLFASCYCPLLPFTTLLLSFTALLLPFTALYCPSTAFYCRSLPFTALLPFAAFYCPLLPSTTLLLPFTAFHCPLLPFTTFYCLLLRFTDFFPLLPLPFP